MLLIEKPVVNRLFGVRHNFSVNINNKKDDIFKVISTNSRVFQGVLKDNLFKANSFLKTEF